MRVNDMFVAKDHERTVDGTEGGAAAPIEVTDTDITDPATNDNTSTNADDVGSSASAIVDAATRSLLRQQQKEARAKSRERRHKEAQQLQAARERQQLPLHRRYRNIYSVPPRSMSTRALQRAFCVAAPSASDRAAFAYLAALTGHTVAPR